MPYVYLILSVFMSASSSIFGKLFNRKNDQFKDSAALYNFFIMISVCLGWGLLYAGDFSFEASVLWYSALFAFCYTVCNIGIINALKYGPTTLTSLLISLSLIVTTIWGFIFWNAKLTGVVIIGLILVACSIFLCLYSKEKEAKKVSIKWLFYVAIAFLGNAGCSIVQRTQQMKYNGLHGNQLMLFATGASAIVCLLIYLNSDRSDSPKMIKKSGWIPVCAGICNLVLNVFVMKLAVTELSPSLIYPVIGVGSLAVVTVFSLVLFKEKMWLRQWIGVVVGAVAVVLLSI